MFPVGALTYLCLVLIRDPIRAVQTELGLIGRDALFAPFLGVDETELLNARSGGASARAAVVERAALVLGVDSHELLFKGAAGRATTKLLKTVAAPVTEPTRAILVPD